MSQEGWICRLEWGRRGALEAAERGDVLVVVDTLSFSSAVATAVQHGGCIYPCPFDGEAIEQGRLLVDEVAVNRREVPEKGRFSLSPPTFMQIEPGSRVLLASPNGATCSYYARKVPALFVGTLLNANAVAVAVMRVLNGGEQGVTVLAAGERWPTPSEDGMLRFAIEDYLGAGAILSRLACAKSPEARLCEAAFTQAGNALQDLIWECDSGQELRGKGYGGDVRHSAQLDLYDAVPVMRDGYLVRF